jgi:DNA-directed RNA polymerase I, II, and III subunit RPABC1
MDYQEKQILYKVRQTVLEMINDRGIIVPEQENITFEQFNVKYDNNNLDIYINIDSTNSKYYVHFHNDIKNFSKADLKSIVTKIITKYEDPTINLILILKDKENSSISKELTKETYKNVEIFLRKNMIFNITHHVFQPKFFILSKEEETELIDKYYTSKSKLPKMSKNDPIAKYYGIKSEQIFKIIRRSPEVGESIYYRLVR